MPDRPAPRRHARPGVQARSRTIARRALLITAKRASGLERQRRSQGKTGDSLPGPDVLSRFHGKQHSRRAGPARGAARAITRRRKPAPQTPSVEFVGPRATKSTLGAAEVRLRFARWLLLKALEALWGVAQSRPVLTRK